ncbi:lycopene cyclase domain-containing protein [Agromyces sp. LHK192]|uniref:lycopene cyclase domain-containing protein n=1 Tax=Agromyces sp. LHK192 TaxID=2498704 RepID=UPI000FDA664E|nr:lycopene cyclase domain-containing protein [Agromyces sp. LHK192]
MTLLYLALLLASIGCMVLLDRRFTLFLWRAPRRAAATLAIGLAFLVCWDLAGIAMGIFLHTPNEITTGLMLAPHLPLEEVVFLLFLCYLSMVLYEGSLRVFAVRSSRGRGSGAGDSRAGSPRSGPSREHTSAPGREAGS